jgi:hypothetical protein
VPECVVVRVAGNLETTTAIPSQRKGMEGSELTSSWIAIEGSSSEAVNTTGHSVYKASVVSRWDWGGTRVAYRLA